MHKISKKFFYTFHILRPELIIETLSDIWWIRRFLFKYVINFDFQGFVDLMIHEIFGGWAQIMSKLDFYSEISITLPFLQTMTGHRLLHAP